MFTPRPLLVPKPSQSSSPSLRCLTCKKNQPRYSNNYFNIISNERSYTTAVAAQFFQTSKLKNSYFNYTHHQNTISTKGFKACFSSAVYRNKTLFTNNDLLSTRSKDKKGGKKGGKGGDEEGGAVELDLEAISEKMERSIASFSESVANYRIERASPSLLENVEVEEQVEGKKKGNKVLLCFLGNISVLDNKTLLVQVPDSSVCSFTSFMLIQLL